MKGINYLIFIQDDKKQEKLVATTPSLEMAKESAAWMSDMSHPDRNITASLLCVQEDGGPVREMDRYLPGQEKPEIISQF